MINLIGVYHIASVLQMKLVIVLLILGLVSATLCCSGWNKSKPCFCECEDAKADQTWDALLEKHTGVTSGTLKIKRLKNLLEYRQVRSKSKD
jgi:hypothetical protein